MSGLYVPPAVTAADEDQRVFEAEAARAVARASKKVEARLRERVAHAAGSKEYRMGWRLRLDRNR